MHAQNTRLFISNCPPSSVMYDYEHHLHYLLRTDGILSKHRLHRRPASAKHCLMNSLAARWIVARCFWRPSQNYIYRQSSSTPQAVDVNFEELRKGLDNKSLIYVDVRNPNELIADGKVVGSVNLPLPQLEEAFRKSDEDFAACYGFPKPAKDATNVVLACQKGVRIFTALEKLNAMGFKSVKIYKGSFLDWKAKGGPIEMHTQDK